jgi:flagellin-like hook-associated protein FlgL
MARIGSAISGIELQLLNNLAAANAEVTLSNFRMATGHKINSPKDNPSAFVTLSGVQSQLNVVTSTLSNVTAADSMVSQTSTTLNSTQSQINTIRTELLKDKNHTLTPDQRAESQAKIDAAINQINSLAGTSIMGKTVLSGSANYTYSGVNDAQVTNLVVHSKPKGDSTISGQVLSTATQAQLSYTGSSGEVTDPAKFTLTGQRGSVTVTVTAGETLTDVRDFVNNNSYITGVTAAIDGLNPDQLNFTSVDYGSSAVVDVNVISGSFTVSDSGHATGTNASAIINGITFDSSSNSVSGNSFAVSNNGLNFEIDFKSGFTGTFDTVTVSGNALSFALSTNLSQPSTLAIPAVYASDLGGVSGTLNELYTGGSLSGLGDKTSQALQVVDEALGTLGQVQASVSGFYNSAITSSYNMLTDLQDGLGKYIDSIDKVNDAEETARSVYYQALADNTVSALTIINQQRMSIVNMLQDIAGLKQT